MALTLPAPGRRAHAGDRSGIRRAAPDPRRRRDAQGAAPPAAGPPSRTLARGGRRRNGGRDGRRGGTLVPVFTRPAERALDLALVVDGAPAMRVWDDTFDEFARLMAQTGAFRSVERWRLITDDAGGAVSLGDASGKVQPTDRLIDPSGRRWCSSPPARALKPGTPRVRGKRSRPGPRRCPPRSSRCSPGSTGPGPRSGNRTSRPRVSRPAAPNAEYASRLAWWADDPGGVPLPVVTLSPTRWRPGRRRPSTGPRGRPGSPPPRQTRSTRRRPPDRRRRAGQRLPVAGLARRRAPRPHPRHRQHAVDAAHRGAAGEPGPGDRRRSNWRKCCRAACSPWTARPAAGQPHRSGSATTPARSAPRRDNLRGVGRLRGGLPLPGVAPAARRPAQRPAPRPFRQRGARPGRRAVRSPARVPGRPPRPATRSRAPNPNPATPTTSATASCQRTKQNRPPAMRQRKTPKPLYRKACLRCSSMASAGSTVVAAPSRSSPLTRPARCSQ